MRYLWIGCLLVGCIHVSCFSEQSANHWFKTHKDKENQELSQEKDDEIQKKINELKKIVQEGEEIAAKRGERLKKICAEQLEEKKQKIGERRRKLQEEFNQNFHENFDERVKKIEERFEKRREEFDRLKKQRFEEFQKEQDKQDPATCLNCSFDDWTALFDYQALVFMSFSVPDQVWIDLSKELEQVGGVFVLRGLPNQSFQTLASRILHLKEKGVKAPIQLDPKCFLAYQIDQVPSIVVAEGETFDKVSGNVSLSFALQKMAENGETKMAKTIHHLLNTQS